MNRVLISAALGAVAIALIGCSPAYRDGKKAEKPKVEMTSDRSELTVSFSAPESPRLSKWENGLTVVSCPTGYHFSDPINAELNTNRICEVNDPPAIQKN